MQFEKQWKVSKLKETASRSIHPSKNVRFRMSSLSGRLTSKRTYVETKSMLRPQLFTKRRFSKPSGGWRCSPRFLRPLRIEKTPFQRKAELDYVDYRNLNGVATKTTPVKQIENGAKGNKFEDLDKDVKKIESEKPKAGLWKKLGGIRSLFAYLVNPKEIGKRGEGLSILTALVAVLALFPPFSIRGLVISVGYLGILTGISCIIASIVALGNSFSPLPVPRKNVSFINHGIFRYMRHPMYSGLMLICLGISFVSGNEFRFLMSIMLYGILDQTIQGEEKDLEAIYPEYASYKARVVKWFPFVP